MFEPFHPRFVKAMKNMALHQYIRPGLQDREVTKLAKSVFTGKLVDPFIDSANTRLIYKNLFIKDIFANLLARWAILEFSNMNIRPVLLMRNPFAVALSKLKTRDWEWMTDPRDFLKQDALVVDYLAAFTDEIKQVGEDYITRQIMIWSVIHYVPLQQFKRGELYILFYENLLMNPETEIRNLFNYLELKVSDTELSNILKDMSKPSRVSGKASTFASGKSPLESWRDEVSAAQIRDGLRILGIFNLEKIYSDSTLPQLSANELLGINKI